MYSNGDVFVGEIIGTAILILFGAGVVAGVLLHHSKARASGWIVISFGWGLAVLAGAYTAGPLSGGQLNPAVTFGVAISSGKWSQVPVYLAGQIVGAMLGAVLCWLVYYGQFAANRTEETRQPTLAVFSTVPEIRVWWQNLITEAIATMGLVLPILAFGLSKGLGETGTGTLIVALLVTGIGLSLGGPTGYAINPARDLGPRIVHSLLPIPFKGTSDWAYAWIPVAGPLIGGALSGLIYNVAFK
ncbi:aquaporin family protein [Actinacidiphila glaucinigra]|uniref:MIP/aquaporin family protein n=1 Tax=Actinacidiphila glaucinigra TaxID=235986 RepID=UPI002DDB1C42|nr:MIP/aquaporin family protein [Actinacidiphila glaucinigra]WSD63400.1 aquaporin family protein [Actinacidiphila glaucinigra]